MTRAILAAVALLTLAGSVEAQVSWTPGFARCARSFDPSAPNYYTETSECPIAGNKQWLLGVQTESTLGNSCAGPNGQSLPINAGPISMGYEPYGGRWAIRLRTNFMDYPHPCPGTTWTWVSFMDHVYTGGGPLPPANKLRVHLEGVFNEVTGSELTALGYLSGITRAGVSWAGLWQGKAIYLDVDLYQNLAWGDAHPAPDVVYKAETPTMIYVALNGVYMTPVNQCLRNSYCSVTIPFDGIVANLIARGIIPGPAAGEEQKTLFVGPFTEVNALVSHGNAAAVDWAIYQFGVQ